jgi:hypothetical protein
MGRSRLGKTRWGLMLLVAAAAGFTGGTVSAGGGNCSGSGKCALGMLSPNSVGAGATVNFSFTLTNEATQQSLGSADLTPPSGWVLSSPSAVTENGYSSPGASASVSGQTTLELRNLAIPPGGGDSVSVSFTGAVSCAGAASQWTLLAKQANNFNGNPGNDFTIDPSSALTVTVNQIPGCTLTFLAQPTNTSFPVIGGTYSNDITSEGFDPSGAPVEVEAKDGQGNPIAGVTVTLSEIYGPKSSNLSGDTSATTGDGTGGTSLGVASFSPIYVNLTGYYELVANAPAFPADDSNTFQVTTTTSDCSTGSCNGNIPAGNKTAGVNVDITNAGNDILSLGLGGFQYSCSSYATVTGPIGIDLWTEESGYSQTDSNGVYDVIIDVPKSEVDASPNNGASYYQICYASTNKFYISPGVYAPQGGVIPGTSTNLYVGVLPNCSTVDNVAPCTVSRTKKGGDVLIEFLGAPGDFWGSA